MTRQKSSDLLLEAAATPAPRVWRITRRQSMKRIRRQQSMKWFHRTSSCIQSATYMNTFHSLLLCAGLLASAQQSRTLDAPPKTVDRVDLTRYLGKWYEIARYPNRFQRDCASDTTAEYVRRNDGKIQVVNACRKKDGTITTARGTAKVVDTTTNAKLKVTFFWPFYGDYWIIGLGANYEYAIIGEPDRKYLWILSRTPTMDEDTYQRVLQQIRRAGYDPARLQQTRHSNGITS